MSPFLTYLLMSAAGAFLGWLARHKGYFAPKAPVLDEPSRPPYYHVSPTPPAPRLADLVAEYKARREEMREEEAVIKELLQ